MNKSNELKDDVEQLWQQLSELRQQVDELNSRLLKLESGAGSEPEGSPSGTKTGDGGSTMTPR